MVDDPVGSTLGNAFAALLRGDVAERDRQIERARRIMAAQETKPSVDVGRKEIVASLLRIAEHEAGRPLTEVERTAIERDPAAVMRHLIAIGYKLPNGVDLKAAPSPQGENKEGRPRAPAS